MWFVNAYTFYCDYFTVPTGGIDEEIRQTHLHHDQALPSGDLNTTISQGFQFNNQMQNDSFVQGS